MIFASRRRARTAERGTQDPRAQASRSGDGSLPVGRRSATPKAGTTRDVMSDH